MTSKAFEDTTSVSNSSNQVGSDSPTKQHVGKPSSSVALLSVPVAHGSRRLSIESAFSGSDISELSFGSTELGSVRDEGILRTLSNTTSTLANIPGPSKWRSKWDRFWLSNYGAFLVLLSQMFGCMMNTSTRILETPGEHGAPMHPFQILFIRQLITSLITSLYALWSQSIPHFPLGPPGKVRLLLVARGFFGFFGVFGQYFSLLYLPISEATILTFLAPVGASYAFSLLIPKETFSRQQQLAGLISLIGVVFIARPASLFTKDSPTSGMADVGVGLPGNSTLLPREASSSTVTSAQHLQAVGVAMVGVCGAIGAFTCLRAIGSQAHALISVNYFSVWCTLVSLAAILIFPDVEFRPPGSLTEWSLLLILGVSGFIMQYLLTKGMAYGSSPTTTRENGSGMGTVGADIEMQNHSDTWEQGSQTYAGVNAPTTQETNPPPPAAQTGPIKGSGAKATSMLYTQMLFALTADKLIFGVTLTLWSWIGSGLILFGAIWVATDGGRKPTSNSSSSSSPSDVEPQPRPSPKHTDPGREEEGVGLLADVDGDEDASAHQNVQALDTTARSRPERADTDR